MGGAEGQNPFARGLGVSPSVLKSPKACPLTFARQETGGLEPVPYLIREGSKPFVNALHSVLDRTRAVGSTNGRSGIMMSYSNQC